jgi:hypothetical protein
MSTTFWSFLDSLQTGLAAHMVATVGFETVAVKYVATEETPLETVILVRPTPDGADVTISQEWAAIGNRRRNDSYTVPALVMVRRVNTESAAAFTAAGARCEAIVSQIEIYLRDNLPAAGDQTISVLAPQTEYRIGQDGSGWVVSANVDIAVTVRVT